MSCNGCRILRKGCNDNCILRQSLQGIESSQSQANATVFVAKFFGHAGLISFLSSVPESQRPALFQSLLFEACGRTVNPVTGAVGLVGTGNWHVCQSAVETVLRGGVLRALSSFDQCLDIDDNNNNYYNNNDDDYVSRDLNLRLNSEGLEIDGYFNSKAASKRWRRPSTPSDESETTTLESGFICHQQDLHQNHSGGHETKLLKLFF